MTITLTPRFLTAYPLFGQGPIDRSDAGSQDEADDSQGPTLKAAPDLPGAATYYIADVVWVMLLGLYGCVGIMAIACVFGVVVAAAMRVMKAIQDEEGTILAQAGLVAIAAFLVSGFFSEEMIARDTIPIFWVLQGMVLSIDSETGRMQRNSHPRTDIDTICSSQKI